MVHVHSRNATDGKGKGVGLADGAPRRCARDGWWHDQDLLEGVGQLGVPGVVGVDGGAARRAHPGPVADGGHVGRDLLAVPGGGTVEITGAELLEGRGNSHPVTGVDRAEGTIQLFQH